MTLDFGDRDWVHVGRFDELLERDDLHASVSEHNDEPRAVAEQEQRLFEARFNPGAKAQPSAPKEE